MWLDEVVAVASGTGSAAVAWTTFDVSEYVPRGIGNVYLRAWIQLDGANCNGSIQFRANSESVARSAAELTLNGGGAVDDTNTDTVVAFFPLDSSRQSFDFQVLVPAGDVNFAIELWGYW